MAGSKSQQGTLDIPTTSDGNGRGGPVYQGVCQQIRMLFPAGRDAGHQARCKCSECLASKDQQARVAGWIASARSIAASIDRVSGATGRYQASGVQLSALHERLDAALERLSPATRDKFDEWLDGLDDDDEQEATGGDAEAPHAAQQ